MSAGSDELTRSRNLLCCAETGSCEGRVRGGEREGRLKAVSDHSTYTPTCAPPAPRDPKRKGSVVWPGRTARGDTSTTGAWCGCMATTATVAGPSAVRSSRRAGPGSKVVPTCCQCPPRCCWSTVRTRGAAAEAASAEALLAVGTGRDPREEAGACSRRAAGGPAWRESSTSIGGAARGAAGTSWAASAMGGGARGAGAEAGAGGISGADVGAGAGSDGDIGAGASLGARVAAEAPGPAADEPAGSATDPDVAADVAS